MKLKWRCSCGFEGESDIGCWMRCDNKGCNGKNSFQIIDLNIPTGQAFSFEERLSRLEMRIRKDDTLYEHKDALNVSSEVKA